MREPQLPYDPEVDTFGDRILEIDSTKLTYEQAYENPLYVDKALDLEHASDTGIPIEFTQFVLRKMAVDEVDCPSFEAALDPRAREYLLKLIGPKESEERKVHQEILKQHPTSFRGRFVKLYCRKVIANLRNADYEDEYFDKFARVFPFQIRKNVPEYEIDILNDFDDRFYDEVQFFLDEHFDENVSARETTGLFLNNIRHFLSTMPDGYLGTFPKLNDTGIIHFQYLYKEYKNIRMNIINCKRLRPALEFKHEDFKAMPLKNINEMASLFQSITFRTEPDTYSDIFKKYLFFFVHALEIEEGQTPEFFIDDMLFQCLKSLRRFRTHRDDINMVEDIAMITLINCLGCEKDWGNRKGYHINSTTLQNIKEYITNFISDQNNVQFYQQYKTDLFCELSFRVNNTICFDVYYSNNSNKFHRGVRNFLRHLISSVLSPDDAPIESIVSYSAYLGKENRYVIPRNIVESVRNFVRLSTKKDISSVSREPIHNVFLHLLRDRLIISQTHGKFCTIPSSFADKTVTYKCYGDGAKSCNKSGDHSIAQFTIANFECNQGYVNDLGNKFKSVCLESEWIPPIYKCNKICDKINPINVDLTCYNKNSSVDCEGDLFPGTRIRSVCKPLHTNRDFINVFREITCQEDGKLDHALFSCIPECGRPYNQSYNKIPYERSTPQRYNESPWHVGIYDVKTPDERKVVPTKNLLVCGGTIISPRLILTAAYCFYDQVNDKKMDAGNYEVVVSKATTKYSEVGNSDQRSYKIKEIRFSNRDFRGSPNYYASDIAILVPSSD